MLSSEVPLPLSTSRTGDRGPWGGKFLGLPTKVCLCKGNNNERDLCWHCRKRAVFCRRDFACKSNCAPVSPSRDADCPLVVMHKLPSFFGICQAEKVLRGAEQVSTMQWTCKKAQKRRAPCNGHVRRPRSAVLCVPRMEECGIYI